MVKALVLYHSQEFGNIAIAAMAEAVAGLNPATPTIGMKSLYS